jgi:hypothetical protein
MVSDMHLPEGEVMSGMVSTVCRSGLRMVAGVGRGALRWHGRRDLNRQPHDELPLYQAADSPLAIAGTFHPLRTYRSVTRTPACESDVGSAVGRGVLNVPREHRGGHRRRLPSVVASPLSSRVHRRAYRPTS